MYAQVALVQPCANNAQHIEHLSRATCHLPVGTKGQLSYQVRQSWNRVYFRFILLAESITWWRRGGNWRTRRNPPTISFRKCHILKPENSSPNQDSNPQSSFGGRLGRWHANNCTMRRPQHTYKYIITLPGSEFFQTGPLFVNKCTWNDSNS